jgi:hypothetical protein
MYAGGTLFEPAHCPDAHGLTIVRGIAEDSLVAG